MHSVAICKTIPVDVFVEICSRLVDALTFAAPLTIDQSGDVAFAVFGLRCNRSPRNRMGVQPSGGAEAHRMGSLGSEMLNTQHRSNWKLMKRDFNMHVTTLCSP